jgi:hypothetical protein
MTRRSQLGGFASTRAVINAYSTGGGAAGAGVANHTGRVILSGALTANTFATLLTATGKGELSLLGLYTMDATSRTLRLRVTVDGVVVFGPTATTATTTSGAGIVAAGSMIYGTTNVLIQGAPIRYNSSLLVEVATSLTETDKVAIGYILHQA